MSFWNTIKDVVESPITAVGGLVSGLASSFLGKQGKGDSDERNMINDQIKAYRDQTELTRQQLATTQAAQDVERRRIEQKQIRALRGTYRSAGLGAGLLGSAGGTGSDMNTKLGG
jgi:hypothetical protein